MATREEQQQETEHSKTPGFGLCSLGKTLFLGELVPFSTGADVSFGLVRALPTCSWGSGIYNEEEEAWGQLLTCRSLPAACLGEADTLDTFLNKTHSCH